MKHKKGWIRCLSDAADLKGEAFPRQPLMEIYGNERLLIEHHNGVTEYGDKIIRIRMGYGIACIEGRNLELSMMTGNQLVITGRIESVNLCRG